MEPGLDRGGRTTQGLVRRNEALDQDGGNRIAGAGLGKLFAKAPLDDALRSPAEDGCQRSAERREMALEILAQADHPFERRWNRFMDQATGRELQLSIG